MFSFSKFVAKNEELEAKVAEGTSGDEKPVVQNSNTQEDNSRVTDEVS